MINYPEIIHQSNLSIYDEILPNETNLYIPLHVLESILSDAMVGLSLAGLPLRTRSKVVKTEVCRALGYPVPASFTKTQPRFPGQNFDVYTQKSLNVQIWNEEIDFSRRYVFFEINEYDVITSVKVITGETLVQYDRTGKLTSKYQATMHHFESSNLFSDDSETIQDYIIDSPSTLVEVNPNSLPRRNQLLRISEIYRRLLPMVGKSVRYLDAVQERNRGAELHAMICNHLGYSIYEDDGNYPDVVNQLLEIKLQTSPTIDLGLHSPEDGAFITSLQGVDIYSEDIRYAIFDGEVHRNQVILRNLYLIAGHAFSNYFPVWKGKNSKIQLPLPSDFFD